ncbi:MAG: DUF1028 domain-containing protein [Candidatus Eisenbacteria bacterium]
MSAAFRRMVSSLALAAVLALVSTGPSAAAAMRGVLSIVALDRATGTIGVAVVSDAPGCGSEVPWVEAGVGAIATQGDANPGWGPRGLEFLRRGVPAQAVVDSLYRNDPGYLRRQVGVIDRNGVTGGFTGLELIGFAAGVIDSFVAVQGNSLSYTTALMALHDTMLARSGLPLPERLLHGIAWGATQARGPLRSAALLVGRADPERPASATRWIDLRVDDHPSPVAELERLFRLHAAGRLVESHVHFAAQAKRAGATKLEQADRARAEQLMTRALADTSLTPHALGAMAMGLSQHGTHLEQAAKAIERALVREPKNRSFLDTASVLAEKRGDRAGALTFARRAAEAAPRDEYLQERAKTLGAAAAAKK